MLGRIGTDVRLEWDGADRRTIVEEHIMNSR